ncbi:MAG: DUF488 domain-containing protein [Bacteroidales bacterium]|nr:DUF488 domain-containing protein [Bacteroidales bacterium]
MLFLFTQRQAKKEYDFVPYKYGCYSYSANADLTAMAHKGILTETLSSFTLNDTADYLNMLKPEDRAYLQEINSTYGTKSYNVLMKYTYVRYPYWAINSMATNILSPAELAKVAESRPKSDKIILFTIGYEGISLEEYLNRLIRNDVKVLVDVRNNPVSMKYGFSKSTLKRFCDNMGIQYVHFPEVGIRSEQRQELNTQDDYNRLFADYRAAILTRTQATQNDILGLLIKYQRIALTCFEANICQCHRKHLAEAISRLPKFNYELKHI